MKKVYLVFESSPSWTFPRLCGVFSSQEKAKNYVDGLYESRFRVLCSDPDSSLTDHFYKYLPFFVN